MKIRDIRGFSILEVAISGAVLALFIAGALSFSQFISKAGQSNVVTGNFSQILSTLDTAIRTPDCDLLFGGLPLISGGTSAQPFAAGTGLGTTSAGFTLNPAAGAPVGFAFLGQTPGSVPPSFQFTVLKNAATTLPGFPNIVQDTVDFKISLQKVDSTGKPLTGAPIESKDYILNLWVDNTTGKTIPLGSSGGTCTYAIPSVYNVVVTPAPCTSPNSTVTVTWQQNPTNATPTIHPNWTGAIVGTAGVTTQYITTPATNSLALNVKVSIVDSLGNTATSAPSANFNSVYAPFLGPIGLPTPVFSSYPQPFLPFQVTSSNVSDSGGAVNIVGVTAGYPVIGSPLSMNPNGTTSVPVNLTGPFTSARSFNYTITATNVCAPPLYSPATQTATEMYQLPCVGSCASPPAVCPVGTPYSDGCSATGCTCSACTGCPTPSTFCPLVPPVPANDSCGNPCSAGTAPNVCNPITAAACISPATFAGSCGGSCACAGVSASPSPSPSASASCPPITPKPTDASCNTNFTFNTLACKAAYVFLPGLSCVGVNCDFPPSGGGCTSATCSQGGTPIAIPSSTQTYSNPGLGSSDFSMSGCSVVEVKVECPYSCVGPSPTPTGSSTTVPSTCSVFCASYSTYEEACLPTGASCGGPSNTGGTSDCNIAGSADECCCVKP